MTVVNQPPLANAFLRAVEGIMRRLHVALPGRVEKYDATTQLADVKPMIPRLVPRRIGGYLAESIPVIPAVPVVFPRCGKFFVSFPIEKGDSVLLVFCDYDPQEWRRTGDEVSPGIDARGHVSNAVAIPGIEPKSRALVSASATDMVIGQDGTGKPRIVIEPDGNVRAGTQSGAEDFVALAGKVDAIFNILATWTVAPNDGGAALQTAIIGAWTPGTSSAAATKVKAD